MPSRPTLDIMAKTSAIIAAAEDPADMRRRMGAAALEASDSATHSSLQAQRRATVAARLPSEHWPQQAAADAGGRCPHR